MSDSGAPIERWKAPSFKLVAPLPEPVDLAELEKQARAKGFEAGKREGIEKGQAEVQVVVKRLLVLAEEMACSLQSLDETVSRELATLAMIATRQIVRRELRTDSAVVEGVVKDALAKLSSLETRVEIYVNPEDLSLATGVAQAKLEGKSWKMLEDPAMLPGGCRVKTPTSFVDASVERQMEKVFEVLNEVKENAFGG